MFKFPNTDSVGTFIRILFLFSLINILAHSLYTI